jgi:hypothetical protein
VLRRVVLFALLWPKNARWDIREFTMVIEAR